MVQKRKTLIEQTTYRVRRKVSYRIFLTWGQECSFGLFRHLPVWQELPGLWKTACPVTTQCLLMGFLSWKGLLSVLLMVPCSVLQLYWYHTKVLKSFPKPGTCLQLDLEVWRNVCRRWTMAFGVNCSCFVRYRLVLSQYLTNTSQLYLSYHIIKLQEVLVRDFQRQKFYEAFCVQWAGLFLRHSECSSSMFFLAVLYSMNQLKSWRVHVCMLSSCFSPHPSI